MSLISEKVKGLRYMAINFSSFSYEYKILTDAADTIEELSAKLSSENINRSKKYYDNDMEYAEIKIKVPKGKKRKSKHTPIVWANQSTAISTGLLMKIWNG